MGKKIPTSTIWTQDGVKLLIEEFDIKQMWTTEIMPLVRKRERTQTFLEHI